MILKMLNKKIKNFKHDKISVEKDQNRGDILENDGIAWISSDDIHSV